MINQKIVLPATSDKNRPVFLNVLEFRVTPHTFRNQPGKLSLTLKCVSTISNLDMNPRYTEGRHQKESTHFSLGSLFNSGKFQKILQAHFLKF